MSDKVKYLLNLLEENGRNYRIQLEKNGMECCNCNGKLLGGKIIQNPDYNTIVFINDRIKVVLEIKNYYYYNGKKQYCIFGRDDTEYNIYVAKLDNNDFENEICDIYRVNLKYTFYERYMLLLCKEDEKVPDNIVINTEDIYIYSNEFFNIEVIKNAINFCEERGGYSIFEYLRNNKYDSDFSIAFICYLLYCMKYYKKKTEDNKENINPLSTSRVCENFEKLYLNPLSINEVCENFEKLGIDDDINMEEL